MCYKNLQFAIHFPPLSFLSFCIEILLYDGVFYDIYAYPDLARNPTITYWQKVGSYFKKQKAKGTNLSCLF